MSFLSTNEADDDAWSALGEMQCLIFDLDGTLLNRPQSLPSEANKEALKLLCTDSSELSALVSKMREVSAQFTDGKGILASKTHQFQRLIAMLGIADDSLCDRLFQKYMEYYLSKISVYADVTSTLRNISGQSIRVGLITNSPDDIVVAALKHFGIHSYFDFIVVASLVQFPKPSTGFCQNVLESAGCEPNRILVVGDGDEDQVTARMIGARFCRVSRESDQSVRDPNGGIVVNDLGSLVGCF